VPGQSTIKREKKKIINAMNKPNQNDHHVSQVLLKRLKIPGNPLHCYQVQTGEWEERNERNVCSAAGYNQLLVSGQFYI
jgi:hypothetical protein